MKVDGVYLYRYRLPLVAPLPVRGTALSHREGLLLRVEAGGAVGWGEAAPLEGFSSETLEDAQAALHAWLPELLNAPVPVKPVELAGGETAWNRTAPSVQFALSTAVAMLKAQTHSSSGEALFGRSPRESIPLNALVTGEGENAASAARQAVAAGYSSIKLKVGRQDLATDVDTVRAVSAAIEDRAALRLDANRAWNYRDAERFARGIRGVEIEYIEEPLEYWKLLFTYRLYTRLEYAVDETLALYRHSLLGEFLSEDRDELPPDELWDDEQRQHLRHIVKRARAHVIKPTMFGGLRDMAAFVESATSEWSARPVFSSSFESGVGLILIANVAAALDPGDTPIGIDTYRWFEHDLLPGPLPIDKGRLDLAGANALLDRIDESRLETVAAAK